MRNPVACVSCRSAKQRCIHNDAPPCDRCKAGGRADACSFPPPGTSSIHRRPKRPRLDNDSTPPSTSTEPHASGSSAAQGSVTYRRVDGPTSTHVLSGSPIHAATASPTSSASQSILEGLDPFELLTDEVKNSYLRCSYKWSFHHTPTLLLRIRDRTLEGWMAWAILALAIRYASLYMPHTRPHLTHYICICVLEAILMTMCAQVRQRSPSRVPLADRRLQRLRSPRPPNPAIRPRNTLHLPRPSAPHAHRPRLGRRQWTTCLDIPRHGHSVGRSHGTLPGA